MQKRTFFTLLFLTALCLQSCDPVRGFFGLPTSKEVQAAKDKKRQDSIYQAEYNKEQNMYKDLEESNFDSDLLGDEETYKEPSGASSGSSGTYIPPSGTPSGATGSVATPPANSYSGYSGGSRFHVIVGSFRDPANAQRMKTRLSERGYRPAELLFKNGFLCISAESFNQLPDAQESVRRLRSMDETLTPYIYDANERRHVESGTSR